MTDSPSGTHEVADVEEAGPAVPLPADLADERLIQGKPGLAGYWAATLNRLRGGDLGNFPVIAGLVVISLFFYIQEPTFLSSLQPGQHHPVRGAAGHHQPGHRAGAPAR